MRGAQLCLAALLVLGACHGKDAPAPAASAILPEAAPPDGLVAELSLGNPKEAWSRVRLLGGNAAQALPTSLPVLLATSLSLPPEVASGFDEGLPVVGVVLSRKEQPLEPDVVLGLHVVSGAELVAQLTLGDKAKFRRVELAPRLIRLEPAPGAQQFDGALGVSGNYLLAATGVDALKSAGRFVAEGAAKHASSEPGLLVRGVGAGLNQALARRLREQWQARRAELAARDRADRQARGRTPDFADPEVILSGVDSTVESWLSVLESSRELSVELSPRADRLHLEATLSPAEDGAARLLSRELVTGSAEPLWQMPSSVSAALLLRGDTKTSPAAPDLGEALAQLFGERMSPREKEQLRAALQAFASVHRGASVLALSSGPAPALLATFELADEPKFSGALADVVALLRLPAVSRLLAGSLGTPELELKAAAGRARVRFRAAASAHNLPLPSGLSLAWEAKAGVGYLVISPDPGLGLKPFGPGFQLGATAWLEPSKAELGNNAALALFADARAALPGGPDAAPLLLTFGARGAGIGMTLDISAAALPAVARLFALERSP